MMDYKLTYLLVVSLWIAQNLLGLPQRAEQVDWVIYVPVQVRQEIEQRSEEPPLFIHYICARNSKTFKLKAENLNITKLKSWQSKGNNNNNNKRSPEQLIKRYLNFSNASDE